MIPRLVKNDFQKRRMQARSIAYGVGIGPRLAIYCIHRLQERQLERQLSDIDALLLCLVKEIIEPVAPIPAYRATGAGVYSAGSMRSGEDDIGFTLVENMNVRVDWRNGGSLVSRKMRVFCVDATLDRPDGWPRRIF